MIDAWYLTQSSVIHIVDQCTVLLLEGCNMGLGGVLLASIDSPGQPYGNGGDHEY
jgi:hypothetical protein